MGFPIRKSADQSSFAAPHGLSQRTTSFIACACQGIHRTPFRHLIALIINARRSRPKGGRGQKTENRGQKSAPSAARSSTALHLGPAPRQEAPDPLRPAVESDDGSGKTSVSHETCPKAEAVKLSAGSNPHP